MRLLLGTFPDFVSSHSDNGAGTVVLVAEGTSIGQKRIQEFPKVVASRLRLVIDEGIV
jgi:hypothetical protein